MNALRPLFASFALNALFARLTLRALWALNPLLALRARIARVSFRALVARIALFPFEIMERKRKGFSRIRPARSHRNRRSSHSSIYSGSDFPESSSSTSRALRASVTLFALRPWVTLRPLRPNLSSRPSVTGIAFISLFALGARIAFSALQLPLRQPLPPIRGVPHVNGVRFSCADVVHPALLGLSYSCLQCPQGVISPKDVKASTGLAFIPLRALRAYRTLGANVTGITFYALRALGASHAHRGRIIQSAIVSPANNALA